MKTDAPLSRWPLVGAVIASLAVVGVVMANAHDPVAIEPDAPRKDGASVATFALG